MARAVLDVGDLVLVGLAVGARVEFIENGAEGVHDFKIRFFVPAANVVDLAYLARFEDASNGAAVVLDV